MPETQNHSTQFSDNQTTQHSDTHTPSSSTPCAPNQNCFQPLSMHMRSLPDMHAPKRPAIQTCNHSSSCRTPLRSTSASLFFLSPTCSTSRLLFLTRQNALHSGPCSFPPESALSSHSFLSCFLISALFFLGQKTRFTVHHAFSGPRADRPRGKNHFSLPE